MLLLWQAPDCLEVFLGRLHLPELRVGVRGAAGAAAAKFIDDADEGAAVWGGGRGE